MSLPVSVIVVSILILAHSPLSDGRFPVLPMAQLFIADALPIDKVQASTMALTKLLQNVVCIPICPFAHPSSHPSNHPCRAALVLRHTSSFPGTATRQHGSQQPATHGGLQSWQGMAPFMHPLVRPRIFSPQWLSAPGDPSSGLAGSVAALLRAALLPPLLQRSPSPCPVSCHPHGPRVLIVHGRSRASPQPAVPFLRHPCYLFRRTPGLVKRSEAHSLHGAQWILLCTGSFTVCF